MRERWAKINIWAPLDMVMEEMGCSRGSVYIHRRMAKAAMRAGAAGANGEV